MNQISTVGGSTEEPNSDTTNKMFPRKNGTYYTRKRVPPKFRPVVKEKRVWISLRTKNAAEARLREPSVWAEQIADWEMRLAEHRPETPEERYTRISARAEREGHRYLTATELLDAKVDLILARTDALAADKHRDPEKIAALLGGVERPQLMLSDLVAYVENLKPMKQENRFKSQEQMHRWRQARERAVNNLRAAIKSKSGADDKPVIELTADDAWLHHDAWLVRLDTGEPEQDGGARKYVTADTGNTDLGYVSGLLRRFYASIKTKNPKPYAGIALKDPHSIPNRKLELPVKWMEQTIFDQEKMSGLNEEARSILIIAAEVGCRQSEIHDLPPGSFRLDHPIPHLIIRNEAPEVLDDGTKVGGRQIKNIYSTRKIALVGHALEAARRHPLGFPLPV